MSSRSLKIIFIILQFLVTATKEDDSVDEGNLALPTSQQPGPLFCLGQNIVDQGNFQAFAYTDWQNGQNKRFNEVLPQCLYGITDSLSLYTVVPVATKFRLNNNCSSGLEDMYVQLEYAYYTKKHSKSVNQATVIANVTFPTGSIFKNPRLGNGSVSFLLGLTASHLAIDWYYFISTGAQLTTTKNQIKAGNKFYYQGGIGRNLEYESSKRIITILLELFGTYSQKNKIGGISEPNSGGNIFYIGPSLWFSTQHFIFSTGIAFPVIHTEQEFGKHNYFLALELGWKFN